MTVAARHESVSGPVGHAVSGGEPQNSEASSRKGVAKRDAHNVVQLSG